MLARDIRPGDTLRSQTGEAIYVVDHVSRITVKGESMVNITVRFPRGNSRSTFIWPAESRTSLAKTGLRVGEESE